jgi:hypothetical protein
VKNIKLKNLVIYVTRRPILPLGHQILHDGVYSLDTEPNYYYHAVLEEIKE